MRDFEVYLFGVIIEFIIIIEKIEIGVIHDVGAHIEGKGIEVDIIVCHISIIGGCIAECKVMHRFFELFFWQVHQ